jgi:cardiolipin synthase
MLAASRFALSRGLEIQINWAGRLGVAPIAGAPFFAMAGVHWLALILLYVGIALSLLATVLYVRDGVRQLRRARDAPASDINQA